MSARGEWPVHPLAALVADGDKINYGVVQPGPEVADGVRLVRVADLGDGHISTGAMKRIGHTIEAQYARSRLLGDEVLVACVGSIGEVALAHPELKGANIARAVSRVRCGPRLDRRFLAWFLRSKAAQDYFLAEARTVAQPTLNIRQLELLPVPLPPLPEQRRIADILDKADAIRRKRKEAIALTEELLRSAFLEMFGDPVTNPKGWPVATIGELCQRGASLVDGPFGSSLKPEHYTTTGVRVVRNWNIYDDRFDESAFKFVEPEKFEEIRRSEVRAGDLLLTTKGTVGDTCLMPDLPGTSVLSASGTVRLRLPPDDALLGPVAVWQMISPMFKRYLHSFEAGSAQQYLNLSAIKKMRLILPPKGAQQAFVALRAGVQAVRARQTEGVATAEALFDALVHRAFRGELGSGTTKNAQMGLFQE